jgi:fructose-1,6-bisphosphatase I
VTNGVTTFSDHLHSSQANLSPTLGAAVAQVLRAIAGAAGLIERELAYAALHGRLGEAGGYNASGDTIEKLDVWGHETVLAALRESGACAALVSEESPEPVEMPVRDPASGLVVCCDPVDGSLNLDVGGSVGTVFSIRPSHGREPAGPAALGPGEDQIAAGYVLYGPATVLVYTVGAGVLGFTLDRDRGEFVLTHPEIRVPQRGKIYGINEGNVHTWDPGQQAFVEHLRTRDKASGRPYSLRYSGAMVADVHRILLDGGIFMYPADTTDPARPKPKLRLLYEVAPMALVAEQAGGRASTGAERVLDLAAKEYHQRASILVGSAEEVALAEDFYRRHARNNGPGRSA